MDDIKALDLNLLKALDALLDERNVTRAASRLGLTQPAVSGMLARLRETFDDQLFIRSQRGIVPTPRALEMAASVKQILASIQSILQPQEFDPKSARMTITIAATDYAMKAAVAPLFTRLNAEARGVRISVRQVDNDRLPAQLEKGEVDLALLTPEMAADGLRVRRLFEENYVCVIRAAHPRMPVGPLTLDQFCELDHVIMSHTGAVFRGATDDALTRLGRQRRVVLSIPSFLVLLEVIRSSDLIAVVPQKLISDIPGIVQLTPPLEIPGFTKIAAWHDRTHRDPGHRWIRSILFDICGCNPDDMTRPA